MGVDSLPPTGGVSRCDMMSPLEGEPFDSPIHPRGDGPRLERCEPVREVARRGDCRGGDARRSRAGAARGGADHSRTRKSGRSQDSRAGKAREARRNRFHHGRRGIDRRCRCCPLDRKSTRLNSSHPSISYAVFCLKKKIKKNIFGNPSKSLRSCVKEAPAIQYSGIHSGVCPALLVDITSLQLNLFLVHLACFESKC